ncbi:MAG TPA: recombinase family protein [Gemmataceae bacterium]|nr:recombinase family protein [Gemmataceae bacterium]
MRQLEQAREWCQRNGHELDESLTPDRGLSGYHGMHRKRGYLGQFLALVEAKRVERGSILLVEKTDRLGREVPSDMLQEVIFKLWKAGITLATFDRSYPPGSDQDGSFHSLLADLQSAWRFSKNLSERVADAKQAGRDAARTAGRVLTRHVPLWLKVVGRTYDNRGHVAEPGWLELIPERVEVVQRIFRLAREGMGYARIANHMRQDGVESFNGRSWCRAYIRDILADRRALGEFQPVVVKDHKQVPEGDVVKDFFPAAVSEDEFLQARSGAKARTLNPGKSTVWTEEEDRLIRTLPLQEAYRRLGGRTQTAVYQRKRRLARYDKPTEARSGERFVNVFAGLLTNAREGDSYVAVKRLDGGRYSRVLVNASSRGGKGPACLSFPLAPFEAALLGELREVDPCELAAGKAGTQPDEVALLIEQRDQQRARVEALEAIQAEEPSLANARVLRQAEERHKQLEKELADARHRRAHPVEETWAEFRTLAEALAAAEDPVAARLKLRTVLGNAVESIYLLVTTRGRDRLAAVQVDFRSGVRRSYLIWHRPPVGNRWGASTPGWWCPRSWTDESLRKARMPVQFDLRHADPTTLGEDDEGHSAWVAGWADVERDLLAADVEDLFANVERHPLP